MISKSSSIVLRRDPRPPKLDKFWFLAPRGSSWTNNFKFWHRRPIWQFIYYKNNYYKFYSNCFLFKNSLSTIANLWYRCQKLFQNNFFLEYHSKPNTFFIQKNWIQQKNYQHNFFTRYCTLQIDEPIMLKYPTVLLLTKKCSVF